jgi:TetR/AcrR family transcriptional regulator, transcriptional repressor for nem operon
MTQETRLDTRERILDAAERLVLAQGFRRHLRRPDHRGGRPDQGRVLPPLPQQGRPGPRAHRALLGPGAGPHAAPRRARRDARGDPVQRLLVFVGLFLEMAEESQEPSPGCLFASYCYESGQFDAATMGIVEESILAWRRLLGGMIRAAAAARPPRADDRPGEPRRHVHRRARGSVHHLAHDEGSAGLRAAAAALPAVPRAALRDVQQQSRGHNLAARVRRVCNATTRCRAAPAAGSGGGISPPIHTTTKTYIFY